MQEVPAHDLLTPRQLHEGAFGPPPLSEETLLYLFVKEDLRTLPKTDELWIQKRYADELGKCGVISLASDDIDLGPIDRDTNGEPALLRATCETAPAALSLLERKGIDLVESASDVEAISNWPQLGVTKRKVTMATVDFGIAGSILQALPGEVTATSDRLFIKTVQKGFSADFAVADYTKDPEPIDSFLAMMCHNQKAEILVSPCIDIDTDRLGTKEARFFVFDGIVRNGSRYVHSLAHAVDCALVAFAKETAMLIVQRQGFPLNYVLDVCALPDGSCDVVEINPVSMSLCYVNNSVFPATSLTGNVGAAFGPEFLFDCERYPDDYHTVPVPGFSYTYDSQSHYSL